MSIELQNCICSWALPHSESKSSSTLNITDADLVFINESAGSQKSCRLLDLTLLSLALTCNQSQPMLGSSAESEAYLENSSPEQWHWKVVSAQQREGGRVPSAMKRLTSGGQWGRHSPYHTVCWLTWGAPDQSLHLSHSLCRTECRHSLPGMTHLRMMLWGFICIKGKVPRKEKICGLILEASQTQEINKVGDHQWSPVNCGEEFLKIIS